MNLQANTYAVVVVVVEVVDVVAVVVEEQFVPCNTVLHLSAHR